MIPEKQIREIVLGPRQIFLFDFENDAQAEQDQLLAWIFSRNVEMHLGVDLATFLQFCAESLGWPYFKILQHLFWLAHDLKLHFRKDGGIIAPSAAKQFLLESSVAELQIVLCKSVADTVFACVQKFVLETCGDADCDDCQDQPGFARRLVREMDAWLQTLQTCRMIAQRSGFPGLGDIDSACAIIESISAKWDPFTLIHIFYVNCEQIARLVNQVKTLSRFFLNDSDRWQMLVDFFDEIKNTMFSAPENSDTDVITACEQLHQIILSPQPYNQVDEAFRLLHIIKPHHDQIVNQQINQCRQQAQIKIESLIAKMKQHLSDHTVSEDIRHQALYGLQTKISAISQAVSTAAIQSALQTAEDHFDIAWEAVIEAAK
jgi:hypothetical protein